MIGECAAMVRVEPPCPKCGNPFGFLWSKPEYHQSMPREIASVGHPTHEHLDFRCRTCGYRVDRPTADAES